MHLIVQKVWYLAKAYLLYFNLFILTPILIVFSHPFAAVPSVRYLHSFLIFPFYGQSLTILSGTDTEEGTDTTSILCYLLPQNEK